MKTLRLFILFFFLIGGGVFSANAVIIKLEAVCEISYPPNAPGNLYWADQSMVMHKQSPGNPDLLKQSVRNSEIAVYGYQFSYPVTFFVELSNKGEILKYRIESLSPYIDYFNSAFTPQNPVILFNEQVTFVCDLKRRYTSHYSFERDKTTEELENFIPEYPATALNEIAIVLWKEYQQFMQQSLPSKTEIADMDVYEFPESKAFVSKDKKLVKLSPKTEGYGSEISLVNFGSFSYLIPKMIISKSPDRTAKYSFNNPQIIDDEVGNPLFSIPDQPKQN